MGDIRIYGLVNTRKPDSKEPVVVTDDRNIVLNDMRGEPVGLCYMVGDNWELSPDQISSGTRISKQLAVGPRNWNSKLGLQVGNCTIVPKAMYDTVQQEAVDRMHERTGIITKYEAGITELELERDQALAKKPPINLVQRIQELM